MSALQYGCDKSGNSITSPRCSHAQSYRTARQIGFLSLICLSISAFFIAPKAGAQDCSTPDAAASSACSGQSLQNTPSLQGSQTNSTQFGDSGIQSGNSTVNGVSGVSGAQTGIGGYTESSRQSRGTTSQNQAQSLPEPLTEFQKFVASTSGQILPIYGAELFRRVPSTFAPLDMTPVPPDYIVGPDDELRIRVWGQVNFQTKLRVI
jgi:hypothetical protein